MWIQVFKNLETPDFHSLENFRGHKVPFTTPQSCANICPRDPKEDLFLTHGEEKMFSKGNLLAVNYSPIIMKNDVAAEIEEDEDDDSFVQQVLRESFSSISSIYENNDEDDELSGSDDSDDVDIVLAVTKQLTMVMENGNQDRDSSAGEDVDNSDFCESFSSNHSDGNDDFML